jgi:hypothetical protein
VVWNNKASISSDRLILLLALGLCGVLHNFHSLSLVVEATKMALIERYPKFE